jgi:hypothetical protein
MMIQPQSVQMPQTPPAKPIETPATIAPSFTPAIGGEPAPEGGSVKGLLDYPKDIAMGITEYAAEGQAKKSG